MNLLERKRSSSLVYDGNLLKLYQDEVILPNGKESIREWILHPGAAAVLPLLDSGEEQRIIMVKQYRYPIGRRLWRYPPESSIPEKPAGVCPEELRRNYFGENSSQSGRLILLRLLPMKLFICLSPRICKRVPPVRMKMNLSILKLFPWPSFWP